MPFLGGRYQNIFTVSWTRRRALLNWLAFRSHGVSRLRDAVYNFAAISACCRRLSLWGGAYGCISGRRVACFAVVRRCSPFLPACSRRPLLQAWAAEGLLGNILLRSILEVGQSRQDIAVVRSRAAIRGDISPWRVPGQSTVAVFSPHAFPKGTRAGKAPVRGRIRASCIRNELVLARYARHASEKPCKQPSGNAPREDLAAKRPFSLRWPLKSYTTGKSCHS